MRTALFITLAATACATAAPLDTAQVTRAVNQVRVYPDVETSRPVSLGETVRAPSSVHTGRRSRAELTFGDRTITRIGQNSVFSFRSSTRDVELKQGSILMQVPKNAGGATIRTATVTAAITGTTSMCEYCPGKWVKLLTLEGTQKLYINGRKIPVLVPAGQMLILHPDGQEIPKPVTFDVAKLVRTSMLAGDDVFAPLPEHAQAAIAETIATQRAAKRNGDLLPTNHVISGPGSKTAGIQHDARQVPENHARRNEPPRERDFPQNNNPNNPDPSPNNPNVPGVP